MYDLHTHTLLSDGELLPAELLRRMAVLGYTVVAITDHADLSNIVYLLTAINRMKETAARHGVRLLAGVELTHIPPPEIASCAALAKEQGADIVVVHGESPVEPVAPGTNAAACSCPLVDILAHPGLIRESEATLAATNRVSLEITSRGGHNRTNGHVVRIAEKTGCTLVVNSDAHSPSDLMTARDRELVARGSGLDSAECEYILNINPSLPFFQEL